MTNTEQLLRRFDAPPRIEETGPQDGGFDGKRMGALGRRTRIIHAALCVVGILPWLLYILGARGISPRLIAVGFGLIVPGGGFMACGGPVTVAAGLFLCFFLWKKKAMWWQDIYGTLAGIVGFWLLGALGGLLAGRWVVTPVGYQPWGYAIALGAAVVLFGRYELRVRKMKIQLTKARNERISVYDDAISELDAAVAGEPPETDELDEEQLRAVKFLLDVTVREPGDFSGFDESFGLSDYRYQLSLFGYCLMVYHAKYAPNFHGYLKKAHRWLINGYTDPRTCGYWAKQELVGYFRRNADPIVHANIMLSGWLMPVVAGYRDQYGDDEFEREGSIAFQPFKDKPEELYKYNARGCFDVLYNQFKNHDYPYMLIPCEPHVAFPACNSVGLVGMLMYDRDHGEDRCAEFWDDLYENVSDNFIEIDGSMALRRQYQYGLRHLPDSQIGYNPLADVQNYMHFGSIFPGMAKRCYALIRKTLIEIRDGDAYVRDMPWEKMLDMLTRRPDPALQLSMLELTAAEYGDRELYDALRSIERKLLSRSLEPMSFRFKDVNSYKTVYLAFGRLLKKGYWRDVIAKGMPETAKTGPILTECRFPDVLVAKAVSDGVGLDLCLFGEGEQTIKIERLAPNAAYLINDAPHTSDGDGCITTAVRLDGKTEVKICSAA
ncbi:MAG: hypothetical protein LBH17_04935 [Oscillospiraceae bacterium]|jgi:hypothetical protein|nr:hypothetical protein [Oscillospiraceae bacterium]